MADAAGYEFVILLLLVILVLELAARRVGVPPAAAFILGGTGLAIMPGLPSFSIDPNLVMLVFLPPLLMNGGYFTAWVDFRRNLAAISLLAVGAVLFTTVAVAAAAHALLPALPWAVCFALGAVISPPDAVAAAAVLKPLSLPGRLTATLEGESLLNDASGLVVFRFAVAAAATGAFSAWSAMLTFIVLVTGGVLLGLAAGRIGLFLLGRIRDSEPVILTSLLLPALTYIVGERLHLSGVLATVVTGMVVGRRQHVILSAATRIRMQAFWRVLVFVLESVLFILVGLALKEVGPRLQALPRWHGSVLLPVAAVVGTTVGARLLWVYATWTGRHLVRAIRPASIPAPSWPMATVIGWAGMRGVVTLAAALAIPVAVPGRDFVLIASFATILVTVLVQGTTLGPLIRLLRISGADELAERNNSAHEAWARMAEAQLRAIRDVSDRGNGTERHPRLVERYGRQARLAREYLEDGPTHEALKVEHHRAVLHAIAAGRAEVLRLHAEGSIHDEVLRDLERELDLQQLVSEGRAT